jgi:hypothetical protein
MKKLPKRWVLSCEDDEPTDSLNVLTKHDDVADRDDRDDHDEDDFLLFLISSAGNYSGAKRSLWKSARGEGEGERERERDDC